MTTTENIIIKYKHTILFYVLATIIPWAFWFAAGYVSHHTVYSESKWAAPILGIIGLCFPMLLTVALVYRSPNLRADFFGRFFNFSKNKWRYYIVACLLLPACVQWLSRFCLATAPRNSSSLGITHLPPASSPFGFSSYLPPYSKNLLGTAMAPTACAPV